MKRDQLAAIDHCRQLLTWARQALVRGRTDDAAVHLSAVRRDLPRLRRSGGYRTTREKLDL